MRIAVFLAVALLASPAFAQSSKAAPTPTPSPTATPAAADEELPTVSDEAEESGWGDATASRTIVLGLRGGYHAFADLGSGGPAFEISAAMPITGPWHGALVAGYHTGFHEVNSKKSFFDAEFGAVEGQFRHNVGPLNLFHGVGVGVIAGNSAEVVQDDGEAGDSGLGPVAHVVTGFYYPLGRAGFVGQIKYGFAPVEFEQVGQTLPMGGLTVGLGFDFGF